MTTTATKPFIKHLDELRTRFFFVLIVILICSGLGYAIHQQLLKFIVTPLGQPIYYTTPGGGFDLVFKVSVMFGFLLAMPFIVFQCIRFIKPALPQLSALKTVLIILSSWILLCLGVALAYFVSLPIALAFLGSFGGPEIKSLISSKDYLSFVIYYLGGFGLIFQLPLILLFVNSLHTLRTSKMIRFMRWVIAGSFILAAIMTPTPDLFNQALMAFPIIILYGISILLIWIINKKSHKASHT